ncbi:hypothetical protein ACFU6O_15520 [Streptomyces albidoflavus]
MSHGVLALGGAALCLSGSVWYVPAWADLRAGPDRPASRRLAATAVLLLWAGASAATAALAWAGPRAALACAVAAGLGAGGTALAARARAVRERREAAAGCAAGVAAQRSGQRTEVEMIERPAFYSPVSYVRTN